MNTTTTLPTSVLAQRAAQSLRVPGRQIDLILRPVIGKPHGLVCRTAVDVVFEDDLYNAPLFAGAALALVAAAATAADVPALRATRVDPTESLRCE